MMTSFEKIQVETRNNVGIIRLHNPTAMNAMCLQMAEELMSVLGSLVGSVRAIVITGSGKAFCAGGNMAAGLPSGHDESAPDFGVSLETHINPLMTLLRDLAIPWISAIRGAAAGVGCSLGLAADLVVASETAYFLQAFARIGLVPDGGATYLLTRAVGRVRAMELMLLGERIAAAKAFEWGMVNRLVPDDQLDDVAFELAQRLADGPTQTLGLIRRIAWSALDSDWPGALQAEREQQRLAGLTHDAKEGMAAFGEKRAAVFTGT